MQLFKKEIIKYNMYTNLVLYFIAYVVLLCVYRKFCNLNFHISRDVLMMIYETVKTHK